MVPYGTTGTRVPWYHLVPRTMVRTRVPVVPIGIMVQYQVRTTRMYVHVYVQR
jgi:hypothetical protein